MYAAAPSLKRGEIAATTLLVAKEQCPATVRLRRLSEERVLSAMLGNIDRGAAGPDGSPERQLRDGLRKLYEAQPVRVNCNMAEEEFNWLVEEMATLPRSHMERGAEAYKRLRAVRANEVEQTELAKAPRKTIEQDPKAWYRHYFPDYGYLAANSNALAYRAYGFVRSNGLVSNETLVQAFTAARCRGLGMSIERRDEQQLDKPDDAYDVHYGYRCAQEQVTSMKRTKTAPPPLFSVGPRRLNVEAAHAKGIRFNGQLNAQGSYVAALTLGRADRETAMDVVQLALHDGALSYAPLCKGGRPSLKTLEFWLGGKDVKQDVTLKADYECEGRGLR